MNRILPSGVTAAARGASIDQPPGSGKPRRTSANMPRTRSTGLPWGEEALRRARELDRPIFLSIGYAACHWCHVMAHESFEDSETAALLNREFVPDQGRPRRTPGHRLHLHGRRRRDDRPGRLAAVDLPHPGRAALLRRHLFPARGVAIGCRPSARSCRRLPPPGGLTAQNASLAAGASLT